MAGGNLWTEEELDFVAQCRVAGMSVEERWIAFEQRFPARRTPAAVAKISSDSSLIRGRIEKFRKIALEKLVADARENSHPVAEHSVPAMPAPEKLWERAVERSTAAIEVAQDRHFAQIGFVSDKPVALAFISDQHISETAPVQLARMQEDAELIRDTPGLYAVLGGDAVDNHIKHRAAIINSGSIPGREYQLFAHYLSMFGPHKIQAAISGNHDDWTVDVAGLDMLSHLLTKHRVIYAPDYIVLRLAIYSRPDELTQEYAVKIRHQYRFNSSLNQTHSLKRMWEQDEHDFDVGVICHHHEAAMEPFRRHGEWRWGLRPGSYQVTSGYSRRIGFPTSTPTCPTIVFHPTRRSMIGFVDVRHAASYLRWLRSTWPEGDWEE